jgi:hypothetical protein
VCWLSPSTFSPFPKSWVQGHLVICHNFLSRISVDLRLTESWAFKLLVYGRFRRSGTCAGSWFPGCGCVKFSVRVCTSYSWYKSVDLICSVSLVL